VRRPFRCGRSLSTSASRIHARTGNPARSGRERPGHDARLPPIRTRPTGQGGGPGTARRTAGAPRRTPIGRCSGDRWEGPISPVMCATTPGTWRRCEVGHTVPSTSTVPRRASPVLVGPHRRGRRRAPAREHLQRVAQLLPRFRSICRSSGGEESEIELPPRTTPVRPRDGGGPGQRSGRPHGAIRCARRVGQRGQLPR
jgi:hypothetical protein